MSSLYLFENQNLLPQDGEVYFYPHFFDSVQSKKYFDSLLNEINWKHEPIFIFGKQVMQPRLTAWCGDYDKKYGYSGILMKHQPWTKDLKEIKDHVESSLNVKFNGALLNQYRDGKDSVGWHSDNEKELGINPVIVSISFGVTRTFSLRHRSDKKLKVSFQLTDGSCLLMRGQTQHFWEHSVPKTSLGVRARINITFRFIP